MPAESRELGDVIADLEYGLASLNAAIPGYVEAAAYAEGEDPEIFIAEAMKAYLRETVQAFRLNLASVPINTVADRIRISSVTSTVGQDKLDEIIRNNELWLWAHDVMRDTLKYGDNYVMAWPLGEVDDEPMMSPIGPLTARTIYDAELQRIPIYSVRSWVEVLPNDRTIQRANIYYPDGTIYKFERNDEIGQTNSSEWAIYQPQGETWPLTHEWGLPVIHFRTGMPYGQPEHVKAYGAQQAITKLILNMMANVDFMGFRQRYVVQDPEAALQAKVIQNQTKDGVDIAPATRVQAGPGTLWTLIGSAVGEFQPTEAEEFLATLNWWVRAMSQATGIPMKYFDPSGDVPSGESLREADQPVKNKEQARKVSFEASWAKLFQLCLRMSGAGEAEVNIEWTPPPTIESGDWWTTATMQVEVIRGALGNPALRPFVEHKLSEAGYTEDEVVEFFSAEALQPVEPSLEAPTELDVDDDDSSKAGGA